MGAIKPPHGEDAFSIDFKSTLTSRTIAFKDQLGFGAVAFVRGTSQPIEGFRIRSPQVTVAIHESETFRMDWRSADSDRLRSSEIARGHAHVGDGRFPFWFRSQASPSFFAIAMDVAFVKQIWEMEFERHDDFGLKIAIGVHDRVVNRIGLLGREELGEGGINGRLYGEALGAALAVHLLRQYGTFPSAPVIHKGGLASRPLKRVIEYIHEHLQDDGKRRPYLRSPSPSGSRAKKPPDRELPPGDGDNAAEVSPVSGLGLRCARLSAISI